MLKKAASLLFLWLVLRPWYRLLWTSRGIGLRLWGLDGKQTEDGMGAVLTNGKYIAYGKPYYRAYFLGRIRRP